MQELEIVREKIQSKYRVVKSDVDLEWNRAIDLCTNIINAHLSCENTPEITRSSQDSEVTECCPHCDREITVSWNVEQDGYQIFCPNCGFPIMLCSMCDARDGKVCDWAEIKGCKHSDERYRDYFYKNLSCENAAEIARSSRDNDIWIPVDERLPEDETMMLVTCQTKAGRRSVNRAWYGAGCWHGTGSMSGVTAWMPLPAPYRLERSSNEEE